MADLMASRQRIIAASGRNHGRLAYWLNADDAPVDGCWVDRVQGITFDMNYDASSTRHATYDSTDKLYLCPGTARLVHPIIDGGSEIDFGHHWRFELDVYVKQSTSASGVVFDVGSLTNTAKGFGFTPVYIADPTRATFSWKMMGNDYNPISRAKENLVIPTYPPLPANDYVRIKGWYTITAASGGVDRLEVYLNGGLYRATTPIPRVEYAAPWPSDDTETLWTLGNGAHSHPTNYACDCKLKEFKVYRID